MKLIDNLLDIKNDYVFKRVFGHVGNEDITIDLLKSITKETITDIELDANPISEKDMFDDKVGVLDIKAKINGNINCDIEMQVVDRKNIEKRILFYWSKMYTSSIKQGIDYKELKKGIVVLIVDYNLEQLKNISKFMTKWNIQEEENPKIILTDDLEFYIIELEKVKKVEQNSILKSWLEFIKNPKVVSNMENNEIKKAREELEKISQDEHERYLAELRQKYIMDQKAIQDFGYDKGLADGRIEGQNEGLKEGLKEGRIQEKQEIAKKMKNKNKPIDEIVELTGLTIQDIENL